MVDSLIAKVNRRRDLVIYFHHITDRIVCIAQTLQWPLNIGCAMQMNKPPTTIIVLASGNDAITSDFAHNPVICVVANELDYRLFDCAVDL
ncbi:hypothetical protein D3C84_647470 [compost metagenome]